MKRKIEQFYISVLPGDYLLKAREDESIWESLRKADMHIGECGGLGKCGKCKVKVVSSLGPPGEAEAEHLDADELEQGVRLGCRTGVCKDLTISLADPEPEEVFSQILQTGQRPSFDLNPLLEERMIVLPDYRKEEGVACLEQVKEALEALGPKYADLKVSLNFLHALPNALKEAQFPGVAVIHDKQLIAWRKAEEMYSLYGLVFDLGTTTLVGKIINLVDGSELAIVSGLNGQNKFGKDVISRHRYIKENKNGLKKLHQIFVDNLNHIIARLLEAAGVEADNVFVAVAAGNTTMQHLLLNLDPSGIAQAPFSPIITEGLIVRTSDVGLQLNPETLLYIMPAKSGYIGGDHVAFILASEAMEQEDEIVLGMDLGTNGEIFLGNSKRMLTCSAAAGPALEGAAISHGMIAVSGAIEAVSFEEDDLHYLVVGNTRPRGICGSGLVELAAVLLELGIINSEGLICDPRLPVAEKLRQRIIDDGSEKKTFLVASAEESHDGKPIYLTQEDVRQLQLAKGALAAGIKTLMDEMRIGLQDISRLYLAGALGNYVNPMSAMRIGLIPMINPAIISSLGNAAGTGASMVLLSKNYWQLANEISDRIEHIELSLRLGFNKCFVEQLNFPETNILHASLHSYRGETGDALMANITVSEAMTFDFPAVTIFTTLMELNRKLRDTGCRGFPVLDEKGRLFGMVTIADLGNAARSGNAYLTVAEIATRDLVVTYPDQTLDEVLRASEKDYGRIPVVDANNKDCLLGVLTREGIIKTYRKRAT